MRAPVFTCSPSLSLSLSLSRALARALPLGEKNTKRETRARARLTQRIARRVAIASANAGAILQFFRGRAVSESVSLLFAPGFSTRVIASSRRRGATLGRARFPSLPFRSPVLIEIRFLFQTCDPCGGAPRCGEYVSSSFASVRTRGARMKHVPGR